jgi:hypothetical protein
MPPTCFVEVDLGDATLTLNAVGAGSWNVTGTVPLRIADLPLSLTYLGTTYVTDAVINSGGTCPVSTTEAFAVIPVTATVTSTSSNEPVLGCSDVMVTSLTVSQTDLTNVVGLCGGNIPAFLLSTAKSIAAQLLTTFVEDAIAQAITTKACLH